MKRMNRKITRTLVFLAVLLMGMMSVYAESTTSITDEVATKIKNANTTSEYDSTKLNTLYGVGEANLTANDVVTVNGVECYVLSVDTTNNTAQLITKNIYDQRFNSTNTGAAAEYTYSSSDLKTYMDNFYSTTLASDSRIIDHEVISYTSTSYNYGEVANYTKSTITQKVYALDAVEAETNADKFGSSSWIDYNEYRDSAYTNDCNGFWVSAGYPEYSESRCFGVSYYDLVVTYVDDTSYGARPVFTIDLTVSPSYTTTTISEIGGVKVPTVGNVDTPDGSTTVINVSSLPKTNDGILLDDAGPTTWYVVDQDITVEGTTSGSSRISISGDVNLILKDNTTLTVKDILKADGGGNLTIWGQTNNSGLLNVLGYDDDNKKQGISVNGLIQNGGNIKADIGNATNSLHAIYVTGNLTLNEGTLTASTGDTSNVNLSINESVGIFVENNLIQNGGSITATAGNSQLSCGVAFGGSTVIAGEFVSKGENGAIYYLGYSADTISIDGTSLIVKAGTSEQDATTVTLSGTDTWLDKLGLKCVGFNGSNAIWSGPKYVSVSPSTPTHNWTYRVEGNSIVATCSHCSETATVELMGNSVVLTPTVSPSDATNKTVTWTSSAPGVATVDGNGKVKAVAEGTATITATALDGSNTTGTATITVTAP